VKRGGVKEKLAEGARDDHWGEVTQSRPNTDRARGRKMKMRQRGGDSFFSLKSVPTPTVHGEISDLHGSAQNGFLKPNKQGGKKKADSIRPRRRLNWGRRLKGQ